MHEPHLESYVINRSAEIDISHDVMRACSITPLEAFRADASIKKRDFSRATGQEPTGCMDCWIWNWLGELVRQGLEILLVRVAAAMTTRVDSEHVLL